MLDIAWQITSRRNILWNERVRRSRNPIANVGSHARVRGQSCRKSRCCRLDLSVMPIHRKCRRRCRDISDTATRASRASSVENKILNLEFYSNYHIISHILHYISLMMRHIPGKMRREERGRGEGGEERRENSGTMIYTINKKLIYFKFLRKIYKYYFVISCHVRNRRTVITWPFTSSWKIIYISST